MGAKVPQERKLKSTKVVCGSNVTRVRKCRGAKVLGTFAPEERKFDRPYATFYLSAVVNIAISCAIFEFFDVE